MNLNKKALSNLALKISIRFKKNFPMECVCCVLFDVSCSFIVLFRIIVFCYAHLKISHCFTNISFTARVITWYTTWEGRLFLSLRTKRLSLFLVFHNMLIKYLLFGECVELKDEFLGKFFILFIQMVV